MIVVFDQLFVERRDKNPLTTKFRHPPMNTPSNNPIKSLITPFKENESLYLSKIVSTDRYIKEEKMPTAKFKRLDLSKKGFDREKKVTIKQRDIQEIAPLIVFLKTLIFEPFCYD